MSDEVNDKNVTLITTNAESLIDTWLFHRPASGGVQITRIDQ